ncbi:hypothetical protein ACTFIZ_004220 [Dictyostelium cf. discoideum]
MDLKKVHCIICEQSIKGFKDIIIHFIKHNDRCPICLSKYSTFSKMYAVSGHYYSQGCNNKRNKINGEPTLQKEFYQRLSKITGDNIEYPTNLSDDPFNHMSQQNLNEINLENENENENENSLDDSENVILQNEHENDDIKITKKKKIMLGLENAKSLKFMQQILDFFKNNTNAINEIRYTIKGQNRYFKASLNPKDELIQFEEGFYNTDLSNLEISNMVSDDSSSSSSSSTSHVSSSSGYIPRSIDQTISRVNTNSNSTTLETGDYSAFQSHVNSIYGTKLLAPLFKYLEEFRNHNHSLVASRVSIEAPFHTVIKKVLFRLIVNPTLLFKRPQIVAICIVVPASMQKEVLEKFHDCSLVGGHLGYQKTFANDSIQVLLE